MKDLTQITLADYLKYLETLWYGFKKPLYTLENYLLMGKSAWEEANQK